MPYKPVTKTSQLLATSFMIVSFRDARGTPTSAETFTANPRPARGAGRPGCELGWEARPAFLPRGALPPGQHVRGDATGDGSAQMALPRHSQGAGEDAEQHAAVEEEH